jgi:hypothetical protein
MAIAVKTGSVQMHIRPSILAGTALSALFFFGSTSWAAVDAKKIADALVAQFESNGVKLAIAGAESSGENILLKGITLTPPDGKAKPFELAELALEGVTEDATGYSVNQVVFAAKTVDNGKDGVLEFGGGKISGLHISNVSNPADPLQSMLLPKSFEFAPVTYTFNGAQVFRMDSATGNYSAYEAGKPMDFDAKIGGIHGDFSAVPDAKAKDTLAALGMTTVDGEVRMKGSWNPQDGRMALTEYAFDFKDVGKLNIMLDLSGYTPAFVKSLQEINKTMTEKDDSAKGMAALGLMQQLTFNSFSIRFDDASVANRIIDFAAKQAGQPRDAVLAQAKGMVPFMMMQLQDAEFATSVTTAVSAFLDNPKSIEIKAAPAQAVSFAVLAATGMSTPAALIKQLNVSVTANK